MSAQLLGAVIRDLTVSPDRRSAAEVVARAAQEQLGATSAAVRRPGEPPCLAEVGVPLSPATWSAVDPRIGSLDAVCVLDRTPEGAPSDGGTPVWLVLTPIRGANLRGALVVAFDAPRALDIEMRARLESLAGLATLALDDLAATEALQLSEDRYRGLVENLEDVVFSLDRAGNFTYVSPSITKYGFSPEEVQGESFTRFVVPEDLPGLVTSLARTLAGDLEPTIFRAMARSGEVRHVRTLSRPLVERGVLLGLTGVMVDVTELRRTEERLRTSQKLEAIGRLAGGVAHDFNNLLSVILSYATFANDALREGDPVRDDLGEVVGAARRAAALTKQLLTFSRRDPQEVALLDLNVIVNDLEKMLSRLIRESIELELDLAPRLRLVSADRAQIEQVIVNLVLNARDAMPAGGKVVVSTRSAETVDGRSWSILAVTDEGSGMDEATQRRIFEPFFTTKEQQGGTGLGLATVYGIVQQSQGTISVESAPGRGSTFRIELPAAAEDSLPIAAPRRVDRPKVGTERVLLVENEEPVRKLTTRILRSAGYDVLVAANAGEALLYAEATKRPIRVLVTDVHMPLCDGPRLVARLRAGGIAPPKVLFFSGHPSSDATAVELGSRFLQKPFRADDLLVALRDLLDEP
jgi:PAS domain S-box-containing protein